MKQHDGECAIKQDNDLARELSRFDGPALFLKHRAQPVLNSSFVRAACKDGGMSGLMDEFDGGAEEAAPLPFGMPCRGCQMAEDASHLVGRTAFSLCKPPLEQRQVRLVPRFQISCDQIVLAPEVIIERSLGESGFFGDSIDADGANTLGVKELACRLDDALACRNIGSSHAPMYTD